MEWYLQNALVADEQVGRLQIAVDHCDIHIKSVMSGIEHNGDKQDQKGLPQFSCMALTPASSCSSMHLTSDCTSESSKHEADQPQCRTRRRTCKPRLT